MVSTGRIIRVESDTLRSQVTGLRNGVAESFLVYAATEYGRSEAADSVTATPTSGMEGEVAGLIVKFAGSPNLTDGQNDVPGKDKVTSVDLTVDTKIADDVHLVELSEAVSPEQADQVAAELQSDPSVEWAEPDVFVFPSSVPSDPEYESSQWSLWDEWGLGLPRTSNDATSFDAQAGAGVTVAVIDTGITSHPDLDSQLVPGYDFVSDPANLAAPRVEGGPDVGFDADGQPGRDADPTDPGDWRGVMPTRDSTWHGTQVAGVIAAQAGNSEGIVGVAPGAKIQPIRALSWRGGLMSDIISSITWASGGSVNGAPANATPSDVITMSFAANAQCSVALQAAINDANERGSVLVAAAGNANDDVANYAPANCRDVITVAATGRDGKRAPYSNYGAGIDIAAPGGSLTGSGGVLSTSNSGAQGAKAANYRSGEGTSIAAAHLAGAIASVKSAEPGLTAADFRARFLSGEQVRAFPDERCDPDPNVDCGTGLLTLAQVASLPPGITRFLGGSWGDTEVDCRQITATNTFYNEATSSGSWITVANSSDCSAATYRATLSGNRYTLAGSASDPGSLEFTNKTNGNTLTIIWGSAPPTPRLTLSTTSVTGVINEAITPVSVTPANFSANSYTVSPELPTGIAINSSTGTISGIPTTTAPLATYTITGSDGNQQATTTLAIRVLLQAPPVVTFDQEVGTDPQPLEAAPSIVLPSTTGTKSNHVFAGWYTAATGGDYVGVGGDTYTPASSMTLYARWLPSVRFQFRLSSGVDDGLPSSITPFYAQGTQFTLPTPTRTGSSQSIFNGWYDQSSGGKLWGMGGDVITLPTKTAGSTLQAWDRWRSPNVYRFDPRGGTITGCVPGPGGWSNTCTGNEIDGFLLPTPTRSDFIFDGWWTQSTGGVFLGGGGQSPIVPLQGNTRYYAQWTAQSVPTTVTFSANGGAGSMNPQTASIPTALTANTFTQFGFNFTGWNTSADGNGTSYNDGETYDFSNSVTLHAQWSAATATVTFDANVSRVTDPDPVTGAIGSTIDLPEPTRDGWTLLGWVLTLGGAPVSDPYTVTGDVTLIAQWERVRTESPVRGGPPSVGRPADTGPPVAPPRLDVRPPRIELDTPVRPTPASPGAATIDGEEIELIVERDEDNTELDVTGDDFSLTVATSDTQRTRIAPTSRRSLVAPVRGFVEVNAAGYAPQSTVALYLVPTLSGRMSVRNATELYFLGEVSVGEDQAFGGEFQLPEWAFAGEYSLQINGYTPAGALKSINVRLDLIDRRADAVSAARACVFPEDSVKLTTECRQSLRSLKQVLPESIDTLTIDITGVAYAQGNKKLNRAVALERAERVQRFLGRNDIAGDVTVDVVTRKGMAPGLTLGPPPVVVGDSGKPASTVVMTVEWTTEIGPADTLSEMGSGNGD